MVWYPYNLDREAQNLVLNYRDLEDVLNESHKMRTTVAYGLERFWGEHLRLIDKEDSKDRNKGEYWRDTWKAFVKIMNEAGMTTIPKGEVNVKNTHEIKETARQFWNSEEFPLEDQRIALAVLTQFCDSLVWWTQRYKNKDKSNKRKNKENHETE
ncbi:hypothetical protein [Limnoraphis robusta]|uniref:CRISPR type III-B/RAMP module-associated protein Cmr5 n=1 Tax=Limnoraphis robusta CCNP1315 TaxID=3110306 RepID=A0ABU5TV89_9CYAN|nr:hypothetical protein [Limnoraphis robusta]MEA5518815.1 hypothetical protein [Limnoraphis robusta CCNP1315]MEA5548700.1 hypothetical protein [Limnoraphis robusta CCNP1324]